MGESTIKREGEGRRAEGRGRRAEGGGRRAEGGGRREESVVTNKGEGGIKKVDHK